VSKGVRGAGAHRLDLYEVLQVSPRAEPEVIRAAYRVLARRYHPDVNPAPYALLAMRRINAAYDVLGRADRRARYDAETHGVPAARPLPGRLRLPGGSGEVSGPGALVVPSAVPLPRRFTSLRLEPRRRSPAASRPRGRAARGPRPVAAPQQLIRSSVRPAVTLLVVACAVVATLALSTVIHALTEPPAATYGIQVGGP
jgi:curved DNA-binding protein CbpA